MWPFIALEAQNVAIVPFPSAPRYPDGSNLRVLRDRYDEWLPVRAQGPLGLKWREAGDTEPTNGRNFENPDLVAALRHKTGADFTNEEWEAFGIEEWEAFGPVHGPLCQIG